MQHQYKLDHDTRVIVQKYIRKYSEYKKEIDGKLADIFELHGLNYNDLDMPRGSDLTDSTGEAVLSLIKLKNSHKYKIVKAIEHAIRFTIPADIIDPIMLSCGDGRRWPYRSFQIPYSYSMFHQIKYKFMWEIAVALDIVA